MNERIRMGSTKAVERTASKARNLSVEFWRPVTLFPAIRLVPESSIILSLLLHETRWMGGCLAAWLPFPRTLAKRDPRGEKSPPRRAYNGRASMLYDSSHLDASIGSWSLQVHKVGLAALPSPCGAEPRSQAVVTTARGRSLQ